jgi:hypothetical protein
MAMAKNKFIVMRVDDDYEDREETPVRGFDRKADAQALCDRENAAADAVCRAHLAKGIAEAQAVVDATDPAILAAIDKVYRSGQGGRAARDEAERKDPRPRLRRLLDEMGRGGLRHANYGQPSFHVMTVLFD